MKGKIKTLGNIFKVTLLLIIYILLFPLLCLIVSDIIDLHKNVIKETWRMIWGEYSESIKEIINQP